MPQRDFSGSEDDLLDHGIKTFDKTLELPGTNFRYATARAGSRNIELFVFDPTSKYSIPDDRSNNLFIKKLKQANKTTGKMIAHAYFSKHLDFPAKKAYMVDSIMVSPKYRNQRIANSIYTVALRDFGMTLVSGDSQTSGGARNWLSLFKSPNINVYGYVRINRNMTDKRLDTLFGKLGAVYLGNTFSGIFDYFSYEVLPNKDMTRLNSMVPTVLSKLYHGRNYDYETGLYATWTK
jgi:hypothetical protein